MLRIPLFISICLSAGYILVYYTFIYSTENLSYEEKVSLTISSAACLGGLISVTFVIWSYLQTNLAFIESQRPQLLIYVTTKPLTNEDDTATFINYNNITKNRFEDLSIFLTITSGNKKISMDDLFKEKMVMIGSDERERWFWTNAELKKRGFDIREAIDSGNEVKMNISYEYTFNGSCESVSIQEYRWDPRITSWQIC